MAIQLFIKNNNNTYLADIDDNVRIITERYVTAFRNPTAGTSSFTYTFTLPFTSTNRIIFNHADDKQVVGKFNQVYSAIIQVNGIQIIKGDLQFKGIKNGFTCNIIGTLTTKLGDIIPEGKNLRDIKSFTPIEFYGINTVGDYMQKESLAYYPAGSVASDKSEIAFAYVLDSFNSITDYNHKVGYEDIGISHFTGAVFENIIKDAGYKVAGSVLTTESYKKMLLLYSNADNIFQEWNYGTLNPFKATADNSFKPTYANRNISTTIDRNLDVVSVLQPEFKNYTGDLSNSLGEDGVYTCKASGLYTIQMACPMVCDVVDETGSVTPNNFPYTNFKYFYCFRCITNDEFLKKTQIVERDNFDSTAASAYITDLDTFFVGDGSFVVNMVEGQQYAVQVYVSTPKSFTGKLSIYNDVSKANYLNCTKFDGKTLINPADFLPNLSCKKFIADMFKLYNLYYTIDNDSKTINLFTRDEFFLNTVTGVIDITDKINFNDWEEEPISATEINENYYRWATDDSDYILQRTNYMDLVNGVNNNSAELSFAPLGFISKEYKIYPRLPDYSITKTVSDFFPAIIPFSESNDIRLLTDAEAENNNSFSPRICYYHGNVFNKEYITKQASSFHFCPLDGYNNYTLSPRLSFFDFANQPAYYVDINNTTRDFTLQASSVPNLFANGETIVKPMFAVKSLDNVSANSSFLYNYKEVIQLNKYSNYVTTTIKMNPVLFDKMNGRYLLKINNLTYLLSSITEYDMNGETAKITIYRNI